MCRIEGPVEHHGIYFQNLCFDVHALKPWVSLQAQPFDTETSRLKSEAS